MFLLVAAWFVFLSPPAEVPRGEMVVVSRSLFAPGARRIATVDPPMALVGGYEHACMECHRLFNSPPVELRRLVQHTGIALSHGMNDRCFNCHDRDDRSKLVLHDGTLIGFSEVPRLCSQCHGTVFRDWQRGTHGKSMGSWNEDSAAQHRLGCNDCHDPHSPAYPPFVPLPGPNTLRMGDQSQHAEHRSRHIPLRRWSSREDEPGERTPSTEEHP